MPEHFLAALYGAGALALGAAVWSAMAVLFGPWSLLGAPGLGWMIAWACRYGGRRLDARVRATAWLAGLGGVLAALFLSCGFGVIQASPDAGFRLGPVGLEYLRLFTEPPWLGSGSVLLTLVGVRRALRDPPRRARGLGAEGALAVAPGSGASRPGSVRSSALADGSGSRAA